MFKLWEETREMKQIKIMLLAMVLFIAAGCGANITNETSDREEIQTAAQSSTPANSGGAEAKAERIIKHEMGTVTLKETPKRVVVLFNGMIDITVALGVKPVGAVESWEEQPWFHYLRASMGGVKSLGEESQPNIEEIVALKPDLIIGAKSRHEKIYPQLEEIAPTIMIKELFDWKGNLAIAAEALDKQDEAAQIMDKWNTSVATFKEKMGDDLKGKEISIIRFQPDGSSRIYVTGYAGTIFEELGFIRPEVQKGDKSVINLTSKEQIPQLDGDYIFDISRSREEEDGVRKDWTSHPLWNSLRGVKEGHYYSVNAVTWNLGAGSIAAQSLLDDLYYYFEIE
jgi:iron complex transport system substrate-binding protein